MLPYGKVYLIRVKRAFSIRPIRSPISVRFRRLRCHRAQVVAVAAVRRRHRRQQRLRQIGNRFRVAPANVHRRRRRRAKESYAFYVQK